ncbi:hypothetical protein COCVIDRAFT_29851 [Bipolaris victoriae FI3]|uniref:Uncharacterized protein n=1 Tax=Bipolaris victoriae (strain FI3) TaxID=930091 RepID=W7E540_BIPV3|nr:hypothetical protein COCVIDRAFT_29851 [Bipolaris victoriae FI3]
MPTCLPLKLLDIPIIITTFLSLLALATQANAILAAAAAAAAATAEPDINADAAAFAHASLFEECSSLGFEYVMQVPKSADPAQYRKCAEHRLRDDNRMYHDTSFALADESRDHLRRI